MKNQIDISELQNFYTNPRIRNCASRICRFHQRHSLDFTTFQCTLLNVNINERGNCVQFEVKK